MKKVLFLLPAALVGLLLYMLWGTGGWFSAPKTPISDTEVREPIDRRGMPGEAEEGDEAAPAAVQREELQRDAPFPGDASDLYRIRVTDKLSGEQIPGAQVSYYERGSSLSALLASSGLDHEARALEQGDTVFADREGLAEIPVRETVVVVGRQEERYGELTVFPTANRTGEEEYDLQLERDRTVRVQVVDSRGDPVPGIDLGIAPVYEAGDGRNPAPAYQMATSSSPEGHAVIPHLQIRLRGMQQEPPPIRYLLQPIIPGFTEGGVSIDPESPPEEKVVLQLPPVGRVFVGVMDGQGNKLPRLPFRSVRLAIPSDRTGADPTDTVREWGTGQYENGSGVFEHVVAGREYYASASTRFGRFGEVFPGPRNQDDVVSIHLPLDEGYYALTGRILDQGRRPLAETRVTVQFEAEAVDGGANFLTDPEGFFWVYLRPGERDTSLSSLSFRVHRTGTVPLTLLLSRTPQLKLGTNDLGDVVLSEPDAQFVGSGRILLDGKPTGQWPSGNLMPVAWYPAAERWGPERNLRMTREPDGRFEIHTVDLAERYRLTFRENTQNAQFLPVPPLEFAPGTEGLEINLETPGFLTASVRTDGSPSLDDLWLRLVPMDGQVPEQDRNTGAGHHRFNRNRLYGQPGRVEQDRFAFRWPALWPGGYTLEVLPRGSRSPLVTVADIRIASGSNRDPRLEGIDLGGALREIAVTVTDPAGRPIERPLVLIQDTEPGVLQGYRPQGGAAMVLLGGPYVDLLVTAMGYYPKDRTAVSSDTKVVLEPYPELEVRIAGGLPELGMGRDLEVSIQSEAPRDDRDYTSDHGGGKLFLWTQPRRTSARFDRRNEVAVQFAGSGTYRIVLSAVNTTVAGSQAIAGVEPMEIELRRGTEQVVELRVPEEGLRRALEQIR